MPYLKRVRQLLAMAVFAIFVLVFVRFDSFGSLLAAIGLPQFAPALTAPFMWSSAVVIAGILIFTALFGRVYCSVICPLGLVQDLMLRLRRLIGKTGYRTLPSLAVLHAIVAAMVGGTWLAGYMLPTALLEPFAAGGRIFAGVFQPLAAVLFKYKSSFFGDSVNWLGMASFKPFDVAGTAIVVTMTLLLFILCWRWGRVYCNSLCPVGAVLRMIAGHSMVKVVIDTEKCVSCGVCEKICKAGCIDAATKTIDNSRCIACFNCLDSCRLSGILLKAGANKHTKTSAPTSNGRRAFVGGLAAAAAGYFLPVKFQSAPAADTILPPGAGNHKDFSSRCISCHLCVAACPSSVIRPSSPGTGLRSLQQPSLVFDLGMCEQNCNLCSQICPVMAIKPIMTEHKKFLKIGEVVYKQNLCVVET
ncbi:MAG TPA: 4Fe-4S binding protein, partial [Candidatus Rifleibacterium sp.]|nr:4Fe-4S binding protein [Candidatus Rifleibacterium sp.]